MKNLLILSVVLLSFGHAQTELTVYTAIENNLLNTYKDGFEKENPDVKIKWVRDSTGIITARLLAEKDNPQADVVFGVSASSLELLRNQDLLLPYQIKDADQIVPNMKDSSENPVWTGTMAWASTLCVNEILLKKHNLPMPESWEDLTNPIYKGLIAMPHPASSGTGYMNVTAWIQLLGEEKGWAYMDKLHPNMKAYVHSGTKPCSMAAQGEVVIGMSSSAFAQDLIKRRAPIALVYPTEGLGWDIEAVAIIKNTDQLEAAQKLMDWTASNVVGEIGHDFSGLTARADYISEESKEIYPKLIPNDLKWAAENREKILKQWQDRYEQ